MKIPIRIFILLLTFSLSFCFESCSSEFLTKEEFEQINYRNRGINSIVFYSKEFNVLDENNMEMSTHFLLKVGKNNTNLPEYLHVFDGKLLKLTEFQAKITKPDGSTKTFGKGDLYIHNLSNSHRITDTYVKTVPLHKYISTGDIIEMIYKHKTDLVPLGIDFNLSETEHFAENITCLVQLPENMMLNYKVVNDTITPLIKKIEDNTVYIFKWKEYIKNDIKKNPFMKIEDAPGIIAAVSHGKDNRKHDWKNFGDWYLDLVTPKIIVTDLIKQKALEITKGCTTEKDKMDAILRYSQKNIRYEQVYMTKGEIIPNNPELILTRGYGDCKDYSVLIYALAHSIGINPHLALCYRGRGVEFHQNIPASQFNHMIVHYKYQDVDYWYDGTNRTGIPGITSKDLINQVALVLEKDESYIARIIESDGNLLYVRGILTVDRNDLKGNLDLSFKDQFAIDYFFAESYLSRKDMESFIIKIIKESLCQSMIINKINWKSQSKSFEVKIECSLPNGLLSLNNFYYTSLNRLFPSLLNTDLNNLKPKTLFYFPNYNKVKFDIQFEGLSDPALLSDKNSPYQINYSFSLPAGPFQEDEKQDFIERYNKVFNECNQNKKLIRK